MTETSERKLLSSDMTSTESSKEERWKRLEPKLKSYGEGVVLLLPRSPVSSPKTTSFSNRYETQVIFKDYLTMFVP